MSKIENKILLRKLSIKSTISGLPNGYMENQPVSVLLSMFPKKLAFIYFTFEKISFTDDILAQLGIKDKYEIPKPSKNIEKRIEYFVATNKILSEKGRMGKASQMKKRKRIKSRNREFSSNKNFTPNILRIKNQGTYKENNL